MQLKMTGYLSDECDMIETLGFYWLIRIRLMHCTQTRNLLVETDTRVVLNHLIQVQVVMPYKVLNRSQAYDLGQ